MPSKIVLSKSEIDEIINMYMDGYTHKQIAAKMGMSDSKIRRTLQAENIKARKNSDYIRLFDSEQESSIIEEYLNGDNINVIKERYGCSRKGIDNVLLRNNVKKRSESEAYRTYTINDYYFDNIDTQDKAYILGFLYADGSNTSYYDKKHYTIVLLLQMQDKYILDEMYARMGVNREAMTRINSTNHEMYAYINIMNKHMVLRLDELGIVRDKSRKTRFPFFIDEELYPHFIRGLLDGDGCIPHRLDRVSFSGSRQLMEDLSEVIYKKFGYKPTVGNYKQSDGISYVQICGLEKRICFLNWIYDNADLKLKRKYDLYCQMLDIYKNKLAG